MMRNHGKVPWEVEQINDKRKVVHEAQLKKYKCHEGSTR